MASLLKPKLRNEDDRLTSLGLKLRLRISLPEALELAGHAEGHPLPPVFALRASAYAKGFGGQVAGRSKGDGRIRRARMACFNRLEGRFVLEHAVVRACSQSSTGGER